MTRITTRTCAACSATWADERARFCGRCGAWLAPQARPPVPRPATWRRRLAFAAACAIVAIAAGATVGGFADGGRRASPADLGVRLPPGPAGPTAGATPSEPDLPTGAVRCRAAPGCVQWRLPPAADGAGAPALAGTHLVLPTVTGLVGFRTATGAREWRIDLDVTDVTRLSVAAVEDAPRSVVFADAQGRLSTIAAADGAVGWQQVVAGLVTVRAAQAVADGWLVAGRGRGDDELTSYVAVLGLDAATGSVRWRREAANAALSRDGAVLQDVNGTLTGLRADGADAWELVTQRPAASLSPVGGVVLVGARDDALVVDVATGAVLDEIAGGPSQVRVDDEAVVWPVEGGIGFRSGDGVGWRVAVPRLAGCCSGFVHDGDSVRVLTGRGELVRLDADDGTVLDRRPAPTQIGAGDGRAWLHGRIVVAAVPGSGGLARLHDVDDGDHLADVTSEADALLATAHGTWVVLAPGLALTLDPGGRGGQAEGRPLGPALLR